MRCKHAYAASFLELAAVALSQRKKQDAIIVIIMLSLASHTQPHPGHLRLEEGTQMVMPGDNFRTEIELTLPVALEVGVRFAIRDSGRTVGAGVVTELGK